MHEGWLAKKIIELVCSGELAQAAQDYIKALNDGSHQYRRTGRQGQAIPLSDDERELRTDFMEAARREMGYAGEPLRNRIGIDRRPTPQARNP